MLLPLLAAFALSCSTTKTGIKSEVYKNLYEQHPLSILVMPPINKSAKVEAKDLFYSSLIVPITQRGYYVMPPLLTMEILKEESAYDAEMFENSSMKQVGQLFGVDAVLFTTIHDWAKTTIASQIKVTVEYRIVSTRGDEELFHRTGTIIYSPRSNTGSMLGNMVSNMLVTAFTKEIEMGRKCNNFVLTDMPAGQYSPQFDKDGETAAGQAKFSAVVQ
ncbi:lipoprotein [Bacteroidia bacterium]|nr:lipoprotein [Bacteroidia bacterium]